MPSDVDFIRKQVERSRSKLLDTSKRNNLISFNHRGNSRQHIRVIDELPDFLYKAFRDGTNTGLSAFARRRPDSA